MQGGSKAGDMSSAARMFARDVAACLALSDARKRENAARRAAAQASAPLVAALQADAERRGRAEIDWQEYFRNADM